MRIAGIYKIESKINPKRVYIGSAINISNRWTHHLFDLRKNKHHSIKLQRHYNKYGEADLSFSILIGCEKEDLIKIEQYFIDAYKPYFNSSPTAGSSIGVKHTEEFKKKISEAGRGRISNCKGKKLSAEHIAKITGLKRSPETLLKLSISHLGQKSWNKGTKGIIKSWNKGNHGMCSAETIEKLRLSHIGKKQSKISIEKRMKYILKPILQYDFDANLIKEWNSTANASRELGIHHNGIHNCLKHIRPSAGGYKWEYKNVNLN
jgi:group I intron endonuclease